MKQSRRIRKQEGIALIQILLITAILAVFSLYITQTARQEVKTAMLAQERVAAEVAMHSAESELLFTLLTENKIKAKNSESLPALTKKWNFHGSFFEYEPGVSIKIQDQAGLLNLHFIRKTELKALIEYAGISLERSSEIIDRLLDWQDADIIPRSNGGETSIDTNGSNRLSSAARNGRIPHISELNHILDLTKHENEIIFGNMGLFYIGDFNPSTASQEMLKSMMSEEAAESLIQIRKGAHLSRQQFLDVSGLEFSDDWNFTPSNHLEIVFDVRFGEVRMSRTIVVALSPYSSERNRPYNLLMDKT